MDICHCDGGNCPFKLRSKCLRFNLHLRGLDNGESEYATYFVEAPYDSMGKCSSFVKIEK